MCNITNILNTSEKPPEFKGEEALFDRIYNGSVSLLKLPKNLFNFTFYNLIAAVVKSYGLPSDFKEGTKAYKTAVKMKNSISIFSGAKTFQNVLELSSNVFIDGELTPFNEFKKIALGINEEYQVRYLQAELNAAFRQGESADYWNNIQEQKEAFPLLRYSTVSDGRVRDEHADIDQVIKPVDDPFWSTWFPPNGWNCRCIVEQIEEGTITKGSFEKNDNKVFGGNTGKNGLIFPKAHPYNNVPKEFKDAKKNNFGFKTPSDKQIKDIINGNS